MAAQHTPGPWHAGTILSEQTTVNSHGFKVRAIPISGSGRAIGCVYNGDARPERRVFADPTPEANARLIAAAPELLAALRAFLECEGIPPTRAFQQAHQLALSAVAKAGGST